MQVAVVVGTRPQIIKTAPIVKVLLHSNIECAIVNTGQHYDYEMNKQFFEELSLPDPAIDLQVGQGTPCQQVSGIIEGLEGYFLTNRPDIAIVPGDTNSALGAGIACSKMGIRIAHLEAGARSYDPRMSEELNRRILDQISQVLLCPTPLCKANLEEEKTLAEVVSFVGDTMYDSLVAHLSDIQLAEVGHPMLQHSDSYAFMTLHRAENSDDMAKLASIFRNVGSLPIQILLSLHPRTKKMIEQFSIKLPTNVVSIDPLPYVQTLRLVSGSRFVITDSGGLQKEAFWLGKPVLITRKTTEWMEIVRLGVAFLVGDDEDAFRKAFAGVTDIPRSAFENGLKIFGDGDAASKVVETIKTYLSSSN